MFVDSHCHLDFPEYADQLPDILARMKEAKVQNAMCISVDMPDFPKVLALAEAHDQLFATVGTHPDYEDTPEPSEDQLVGLAKHPKVLAIGETGLDYYRMGDKTYAEMEWQRDRFRTHIRAAIRANKPLIIHTRSASEDTIKIMKEEGASQVGGVMHCFTESWDVAQASMDLGFYISFSGIVTFKSAKDLQATCLQVPLERMLIETDSPFLAPIPHRGKTNEPSWVAHVGQFIADLKGVPVEIVAKHTTENFKTLFKAPI
ncbi:MAG: hypothetical protein RL061_78 [Pseudomonadota bacterium]|jgi:TatD DNase family protein